MHPYLRSSGASSRDTPGQNGTMVLGDGSAAGVIFVSRSLLAQICAEADARARTGPHEHFEIGGLLLGPTPRNSDILVEEAIPLGLEYRFEPSFPMLLAGLDSIESAITAAREGSSSIVGLYRILTRSDARLRDSDFETLAAIEKPPSSLPGFHCCFVVAPKSGSETSLRVLMHSAGDWKEVQQTTLSVESALATEQAAAGDAPRLVASEESKPATQPMKAYGPDRRSRKIAIFAVAGLAILAAEGGVYRWMGQRRSPAAGESHVQSAVARRTGFSANRDGPAWKLTWDSAAVEAMKPTGATLSIQDGTGRQDIALTMADLSSGTIFYTPRSGELAFRLQVVRDGVALAEERVRVLEGIKPVTKPPDRFPRADVRKLSPPGAPPSDSASSEPQENAPSGSDAQLPLLAEAAPITTLAIPQSSPLNGGFRGPPAPTPSTPPPLASIAKQPQTAPPPISSPPAASRFQYVGPRPTKQVQPLAPPGFGGRGAIRVEVLVVIDEKGRVTRIMPVGPAQDFRLVMAVTKAAEFWRFEPARLNGRAVPSQMTLIFRF